METLAGGWIALAFALGGVSYLSLQSWVGRIKGRARMWMIYLAVVIDLTSDGLRIGTGSAMSPSLALALAAGQLLADVPEGYAAMANFRAKDVPRPRRKRTRLTPTVTAPCWPSLEGSPVATWAGGQSLCMRKRPLCTEGAVAK